MKREFFNRSVHEVARELIGYRLAVCETAGFIVETEAYEASDGQRSTSLPASAAEVMFPCESRVAFP